MPGIDFEALLSKAMGLNAESLGPSAIARAVQIRQQACQLDPHSYWLHALSSPAELQELIETVVVPETWFFRDAEAFSALAGMARAEFSCHPARDELRLLSLPCSTGEEPFSMAIALLDAGIAGNRFRIDAIDISRRALQQAGLACYGNNSFRGQGLDFRARHFRTVAGRWQPLDPVRQRVSFRPGNMFAADFLPGQGRYDFIFCRNVMIYFDADAQARAIEVLLRLLTPRGCLFVGPSETGLLLRSGLDPVPLPMAFAFHRSADVVSAPALAAPRKAATGALAKPRASKPAPRQPPLPLAVPAPVDRHDDLEAALGQVQNLANQGRLPEAAAAGEQHLRDHGASARSYCLLGLIRDAAGDPDAAAALYRKALYLEPQHQEALTHLAYLLDKQGKSSAARVLRERLQRLEAQANQ